MGQYQDEIKKIGPPSAELRALVPEVYEGFATTHRAVYKDGALPAATKELMAETIGVTIQMGGGPASVYGPEAWEAFKEFKERYG